MAILEPFIALSVLPIIPFLLVYGGYYLWKRDKRRSLLLAMDVTTLFLILSVSALFNQIFGTGFGFYLVLLFMLVCGGLIGGAQNRLKGKVNPKRLVKAVWRLSFLLTSVAYLIFFIVGLFPYIWAV
ncbi:DUF3397 domain-containing protein [Paenibacillus physcomitrellae]|uniref:DUF3397 domain-containing protein n=1 Tax=Paenibacillus physcomitrellae TaxID=1619311 RepID=A0ABQ1FMF4_9BACL|nr:DUF3397 domain-containing protein [Paenibacillus physcomitrellae]GGA20733.1 hypothetical protein GCM10010917_01790 [Paenibacillus physcomitrellae]